MYVNVLCTRVLYSGPVCGHCLPRVGELLFTQRVRFFNFVCKLTLPTSEFSSEYPLRILRLIERDIIATSAHCPVKTIPQSKVPTDTFLSQANCSYWKVPCYSIHHCICPNLPD